MDMDSRITIRLTSGQLALAKRLSVLIDIPYEEKMDSQRHEILILGEQLARRLTAAVLTAVHEIE